MYNQNIPSMTTKRLAPIIRVTIIYLVFAGLWILFSDQALSLLISDPEEYQRFQTYKGWFFVLVTSVLLFFTLLNEFRKQWQYELELETMASISAEISGYHDIDLLTQSVLQFLIDHFQCERAFIAVNDESDPNILVKLIETKSKPNQLLYIDKDEAFVNFILNRGLTISSMRRSQFTQPAALRLTKAYPAYLITPLINEGAVIGFLGFAREKQIRSKDHHIQKTIATSVAQQLNTTRLIKDNLKQIDHLSTLRNIDEAILKEMDIHSLMDILVNILVQDLDVDGVSITFLDAESEHIHISRSRNLPTDFTIQFNIYRKFFNFYDTELIIPNLNIAHPIIEQLPPHHPITNGKFIGYILFPLFAKGKKIGLIEVFTKDNLQWKQAEHDFFNSVCKQVAIALESITNLTNLTQSNDQLLLAYEQTLVGWSRALELRDKETQDHTNRVTNLTLKMAKRVNIPDDQLIHIKRGALLHDIGKLGVPDDILLKPGPLTESEWNIMRLHPKYAAELLMPIAYLRPSLNIPYCHHEKWDGSGYPQGLKGSDIPIEARIFSIIDVWDALTSDRPYRNALSKEETIEYIKNQSGTHFDPELVTLFLEMITEIN